MNNLIELADKLVMSLDSIALLSIEGRRLITVEEFAPVFDASRAYLKARLANAEALPRPSRLPGEASSKPRTPRYDDDDDVDWLDP